MATRLVADRVTLDQPQQYPGRGSQAQSRGRRFFGAVGVLGRARKADVRYGSLPGGPEQVENDYYRFLNQPRD
jgi:hypothetical protein